MTSLQAAACVLVSCGLFGCGDKYSRDCTVVEGEVTYADVRPVLETHCTRCHAADLAGGERDGAPSMVNYDSYDAARENAREGNARILDGTMPDDEPGAVSEYDGCLIEVWMGQGFAR